MIKNRFFPKARGNKTVISGFRNSILIFQVLALLVVLWIHPEVPYLNRLFFSAVLIVASYGASLLLSKISSGDQYILLIALMLFNIGSVMIYRLEPALAIKQGMWVLVGISAYFITYFILKKVKGWERFGRVYFGLIMFMFIATQIFGSVIGGAQNWIILPGGITIQPVEFIKILLVFLIAYHYYNYEKIAEKTYFGKKLGKYSLMFVVYIFIGFLFLQADMGPALLMYALLLSIQFIYEEDKKMVIANLLIAIAGAVVAYFLFNHVRVRVSIWLDPWSDIDNTGYQITQSLFGIASGGFFGKGLGLGQPENIPLAFTDFIFSAICEGMGIFAGIGLMMLFLILVYRGFKIAFYQDNSFFKLVALGISITFAFQALIIVGGVTKLIPLTGITIPFVTYGGSSILSSFIMLGILQYTSEDMEGKYE